MINTTSKITVNYIEHMGNDARIVEAARVSTRGELAKFGATDPEQAGLINYLMQHRHGSPFEHGALTFYVHAPIFVFREWHRHRIGWGYSEESGRYRQLEPLFWIPDPERKITPSKTHTSARPDFETAENYLDLLDSLKRSYWVAYSEYEKNIEAGIAKEVARACLPVGIYSSMYATCNPRSLMSFLSLRTHRKEATYVSYPQREIEEAAEQIEALFENLWPMTHTAFVKNGRVAP